MSSAGLSLTLPGGGHVLFTDRSHGNLSSVGGEDAERGERTRERLRELIAVRRLARGYQLHGSTVTVVSAVEEPPDTANVESDGQATALLGVGAMVLSADCLPVALGRTGAVAVLHAGWRGLAAGVLEEGVRTLARLGADDEIVAIVGPGAGRCCYEVGPEVHEALGVGGTRGCPTRAPRLPGRGHIDLPAIARQRLLAAGVARVLLVGACTICDERFFSHRREGVRAGRQAGVAWLS